MHVRPREPRREPGQLGCHAAVPDLHVEKEQPSVRFGPPGDPLDERVAHPQPVLPVAPRIALRDGGDEVQRGLHTTAGVCRLPLGGALPQTRHHRVWLELAQNAHALREGVAVVRHDPLRGENGTGKRLGTGGPTGGGSAPRKDGGAERQRG